MTETKTFTTEQATDEAILLFFRRMFLTDSETFNKIWMTLPEGARSAIYAAEMRADVLRDKGEKYDWPAEDDDEGDDEE